MIVSSTKRHLLLVTFSCVLVAERETLMTRFGFGDGQGLSHSQKIVDKDAEVPWELRPKVVGYVHHL